MEGRSRSLPLSFSLQDLSSYRSSGGASIAAEDVAGSQALLDLPRIQTTGPGSFSKTSKGVVGVSVSPLGSATSTAAQFWLKVVLFIALIGAFSVVVSSAFLWGRGQWQQKQHMQFAIVMDCGSTGTRVHVYGWSNHGDSLPVVYRPPAESNDVANPRKERKAYRRMETEPGIHKLLHNETGLKSAIEPLLKWAKKQIPRISFDNTPVFVLATAGVRRLPTADSEWLLDKVWSILQKSPFKCRRAWVRIISGVEEAFYGWVALNYNIDRLGHNPKRSTVGALDLGGSSLEVTFEPATIPKMGYGVNLSISSTEHHLYACSHAGFGLNDAFEKSVAALLSSKGASAFIKAGRAEVEHPCLHPAYRKPFVCSTYCSLPPSPLQRQEGSSAVMVNLIGNPNWAACQALAKSVVVNSSWVLQSQENKDCDVSSCALGKYQPRAEGQFYAVAGFFVMYKFFDLSPRSSLDELLSRGRQFCNMPWPKARDSVVPQPSIDRYCFRTPYVVSLLRDGLHIRDDQVMIGSGDMTWTLGAALLETGALRPKGGSSPSTPFIIDVPTLMIIGSLLLVIVLLFFCRRWMRTPNRTYLPIITQAASPTWLPLSLQSQEWLGIGNAGAGGRNGEGRVKTPHSPAPTDTGNRYHRQVFATGPHRGGSDGQFLDSDVLQLPPAGNHSFFNNSRFGRLPQFATVKKQHNGVSQLQSRRVQSREDLSLYESDIILPKEVLPAKAHGPPRIPSLGLQN
ncbi:hypothetical protein O6H91_09G079700 [Diphasiastrum complanatum]|uniref:Uncharacterized protein n=1 Tax=Diphasiastrum complanatum TaxID=34168 RepID=A0ACC2CR17_DIPCM|nr:hypothetical protein O6H91_09G079700 [Diphasiastrum complanatum]